MAAAAASCLTPQSKHDVFLSFRGEDTRENFTSHLFAALCRKKIKTFIDEDIKTGDEISPALLNAIEGSKISVIIFSKDYASSKWCLDELVKILECKKINGQIVMPIFYHVHPSDVRNQTKRFGEAFVEHENGFKDMPEKVQKWRDALTEACYLSGYESTKIRPEAKLVDVIVKDILKKLENTSISSDLRGLVGLNSRIEHIKSLLHIGLLDFRIVGIWGMGGIGKTTIAEALFNQISSEFEGKCFMANVREESEKWGLVHLQKKVLSKLLEENLEVEGPNMPQYTKERLRRLKVFVVLDDVNKFGQLEYLAGGLDRFGPGSRIIITTRDKQVLDKYGIDYLYRVEGFNYSESLEIFRNYAFKENHCPQDLMELMREVVNYAQGNPLALKVLGSSLYRKTKENWEHALHKLQRISESDIHNVLKISYDKLSWEEKNIFLDIACFFNGEDKDHVTMILDYQYSVHYGLTVLVDKSLIKISSNVLQMHDLLQEMVREIVRQESIAEPGKRSRLWYHEDVYRVLKKNKGTDSVQGIFLDISKIRGLHLSSGTFAEMSNLRMLKFYVPKEFGNLDMSSEVHLSQGLEYLPDELRYLHWHGYPLKTLPMSFNPENLAEFNLPYSKVEQLWEGKKEAFMLKWIDLRHCQDLTRIPDSSETPNLERIFLNSTNWPSIPSDIQNFSNLVILSMKGCKCLRSFPSNIHFRSLITLDLSECKKLIQFPQISGNIKNLDLSGTTIEEVPSSVECLIMLEWLDLGHCIRLRSISTSICKLKSLICAYLDNCSNLENFPENLEVMEHLNGIDMESMEIKELPSSIENLGLRDLYLSNCSNLVKMPQSLGNLKSLPPPSGLSSLKYLTLRYCNIIKIPNDIGCLSSLNFLNLSGNNFESLPTSIKQLSQLEELVMCNCNMLLSLPELPPRLLHVEATNCRQLQSLPELPSCVEELDASRLETLSEHLQGVSHDTTTLLFNNCFKLNDKSSNIWADSQLRIQHMARTSLRQFYETEIKRLIKISMWLPGNGIPDCFSYQNSGTSISIQLPLYSRDIRFLGFALCVVVEVEDIFKPDPGYFELICKYHLKIKTLFGTKYLDRVCSFLSVGVYEMEDCSIKSDHILLAFDPCLDVCLPDDDHHTTASFQFSLFWPHKNKKHKVKCCGVCPINANLNETKSKTFTAKLAAIYEDECTQLMKRHYGDPSESIGRSDDEAVEPNSKRICR